jgi:putative transposase
VEIVEPDQVWSTDITYIPMQRGFGYLVAVMDWFSRYVLSWEVSVPAGAA